MVLARRRVLAGACAAAALAACRGREPPAGPPVRIRVGVPTQVACGAFFVGQDQQLFAQHGVDLQVHPFLLGKQALQAVLDGSTNLAILADTPFMLAALRGAPVCAVSTVFGSRKIIAIAARKDAGIATPRDLEGRRIGTLLGTNAEYFLDAYALTRGIDRGRLSIVYLPPEGIVQAIEQRQVDAVTAWHPDLARLESSRKLPLTFFFGEDVFIYRFLLVGQRSYVEGAPEAAARLLRGLEDANAFIHAHPVPAREMIARAVGTAAEDIDRSFEPGAYNLALDQTLLLTLSDQTRWAMRRGMVPTGPVPNFLAWIDTRPLQEVAPEAVTYIR